MEAFGTTCLRLPSDSGLPTCSNETFPWNDFGTLPSFLSLNFFVEEKIKQVEQEIENIKATKENYLRRYQEINAKIDYKMQEITFKAESRKQELTTQLQEIVSCEILSWERQLNICEKAENWLESIKTNFPAFGGHLQETCNMFSGDIGFISSPQISFHDDSAPDFENDEFWKEDFQETQVEKIAPKFCIGSRGHNAGEFSRPWGVSTDATGRILVADRGNNRIQIFNEHGRFLFKFGKIGVGPGEFDKPVGIVVDKKCRIIVADKNNHRIQVFTFSGGFMFMFGRRGYKPGMFQYPWDVDANSECDIAVSDTKNHRVQLFNKNGMFITEIRFDDNAQGLNQLVSPLGVAFKPDGTLLMTDINNHNIFMIDKNFYTATKVEYHMKFCVPQGIACNSHGQFIIADGKHNIIQVFDEQGKLYQVFGVQGKHPGEFDNPQGVCFHRNGSIIVSDFGNNRIQIF